MRQTTRLQDRALRIIAALGATIVLGAGAASAQTYPRPYISDISPKAVVPNSGSFTLTVRGTGLVPGVSQIHWNGVALAGTSCTAAAPSHMAFCTATVPAANVIAGSADITIVNPGAGVVPLVSNTVALAVDNAADPDWPFGGGAPLASVPRAITVGDFNGDGWPDAVTLNTNQSVTVLLGTGNGGFTASAALGITSFPLAITSGDWNEDGTLDLAAMGPAGIAVFLGNGDGTFTNGPVINEIGLYAPLLAADVNGDGHLDLVFEKGGPAKVRTLLGAGDGTFVDGTGFNTGDAFAFPSAMVAGDFDSDGILDLAVDFYSSHFGSPLVHELRVLKGDGAGGFAQLFAYPVPNAQPSDVATGDVNGDGNLDLVVPNTTDNTVVILAGDGTGNFASLVAPLANPVSTTPIRRVQAQDLDGDGNLDVVAFVDYQLVLFKGDGAGGFGSGVILYGDGSGQSTDARFVDLDRDGRVDWVIAGFFNSLLVRMQEPFGMVTDKLEFGSQRYLTPATKSVSVYSTGHGALTISSISTEGDADFQVTGGTCVVGTLLPNGSSCTIEVTFTPAQAFGRSATLVVVDDTPVDGPHHVSPVHQIPLSGFDSPNLSMTPSRYDFGTQLLGTDNVATFTISNSGDGPGELFFISESGQRNLLDKSQCPISPDVLLPGTSCNLYLHWIPLPADLLGYFSSINVNHSFVGNVSGVAYSGAVSLSPGSVSFGEQLMHTSSSVQSVTLTNTATSDLFISSGGSIVQGDSEDFQILATSTCPTGNWTLAALASCRVDLAFTPTRKGARTSFLGWVDSSNGWSSHGVPLSGTAIGNPVPFVNTPLVPGAIVPGGEYVFLELRGVGFVEGTVVRFNGEPVATASYYWNNYLYAEIPASMVATAGLAAITVENPAPGGGISNTVYLPIANPTTAVALTRRDIAVGTAPENIVVGDFNNDGKPDLAVALCGSDRGTATPCDSGKVAILLADGTGNWAAPSIVPLTGSTADGIVAADFNDDGNLDLVVSHWFNASLSLLLGDGAGHFAMAPGGPTSLATCFDGSTPTPGPLAAADFDMDGTPDLVVPVCNRSFVYLVFGGAIRTRLFAATNGGGRMALGDFDHDGQFDAAVAQRTPVPGVAAGLTYLLGNGVGGLGTARGVAGVAQPESVAVADFDGDTFPDIAVADAGSGAVSIFVNGFSPQFTLLQSVPVGNSPRDLTVTDLNGDGFPDLAVANAGDNTVTFLLGDGTGHFAPAGSAQAVGARPVAIASADFDGDGRLDVVVANRDGNSISVVYHTLVPTTTRITSGTPNPSTPGQSVAVAFALTATPTPTGSVTVTASTGETCTGGLASGVGSCSLVYTTTGQRTVTARFAGDADFAASTSAGITHKVNGANAALTPATFNFGTVYLDDKSSATFTLSNTGNASMSISKIAIGPAGPPPSDFKMKDNCPPTLAAGKSCTITVTFEAKSIGAKAASLLVTDNAAGSPHAATLAATVINPKATLTPANLDFPAQKRGTTSAAKSVTLTNSGTTPLAVNAIAISGDFAIASGTTCSSGGVPLAPGASCRINVTFTPAATGPRNGSLTVATDAKNSPQTVRLTGSGKQ